MSENQSPRHESSRISVSMIKTNRKLSFVWRSFCSANIMIRDDYVNNILCMTNSIIASVHDKLTRVNTVQVHN